MDQKSLIDGMIELRDKILAHEPPEDSIVLYYPPRLVARARIFWSGSNIRVEPTRAMPDPSAE